LAGKDNRFRIIAGEWRGRKFAFPSLEGLRPTPDRVRETIFNWLQPVIPGAHCLDIFAGSGALGLEALSRGAAHCIFVDQQSEAVKAIREHLQMLSASQADVVQSDAMQYLQASTGQLFDVVFLDPPFRKQLLPRCCELLESGQLLAAGARVYMEIESENKLATELDLPANWQILRDKTTGQVRSLLAQRT